MEVFLYNSTVCRLCGEENDNGTLLYSPEENNQNLCEIINAYLPIKVSDDGQLPRTICPGCTIQLEATVEFLNLIINGQKVIRRLYQREREYKKSISKNSGESDIIAENIIYEINTSDGVYQVEHPVSLQVAGLEKPKRKRGRPPKKAKTQEKVDEQAQAAEQNQTEQKNAKNEKREEEEPSGKRRRKTPTRFKEAVQGKELERILLEEGVIDEEERSKPPPPPKVPEISKEPEVIGHLEESGEPVVVVKGKGRGRPKGHTRHAHEICPICGMEFTSVGRYMSHIAQHGSVRYRCNCGVAFTTRLSFSDHQNETGHTGRTIESCSPNDEEQQNDTQSSHSQKKEETVTEQSMESITHSQNLPNLCNSLTETDNQVVSEIVELQDEKVDTEDFVEKPTNENKVNTLDANSEAGTEPNEENEKQGKPKLKCHFCNKMYSSKQSRALHTKAMHMGDRSHACGECGATFGYPRSLALHRISHRRARPTGFACDLCGKVLNHPSSVVYHKQTEHTSQRFVCGKCGKCFRHKQLLRRHQLVHSEARPYSCKMCNATFKTKPNMLNHQLLHTGVKKFSCEICKARFAHKTSLTLHMRWHTGVKPYICTVCGKSFSQKGNLLEHQRIHTGEKPYSCELCPRRFTTSSQHRLHLRRHPQRIQMEDPQEEVVIESPQKQQGTTNKVKKQISLLVSDKQQESEPAQEEEQVIYVAYEAAESHLPAFHIINADEEIEVEDEHKSGELYSGTSLLVPTQLQTLQLEPETILANEHLDLETEQLELESDVHGHTKVENGDITFEDGQLELDDVQLELETEDLVLDQDLEEKVDGETHIDMRSGGGRGLQLTMQDGTRLALASVGGGALQVITPDGQTIPVEINGYNQEEEVSSHTGNVLQQLSVMKSEDAGSVTYFTITNLPTMWKK